MLPNEKIRNTLFGLSSEKTKIKLPTAKFITHIKNDEKISVSGILAPDTNTIT